MANVLGWEIARGNMPPCAACSKAKAKQRNVPKKSDHVPNPTPTGRVFLELSLKKPKDEFKIMNEK